MSAGTLEIEKSEVEGFLIIKPIGDIDAKTAPEFKSAIDAAVVSGEKLIIFDFSCLNYISSAGIGVLNAALHSLKGAEGRMAIANPNKVIKDTLDVMYFSKKVAVYSKVEAAVRGLSLDV